MSLSNKNVRDTFKKKKRSEKNVLIPQLRGLDTWCLRVCSPHDLWDSTFSNHTNHMAFRLAFVRTKARCIDANILFVEAIFI